MNRDPPGHWLTSKEAAALLRVHPKHIYRLLRRGLPAQRVGGEWRFSAAQLQAWAQRGRDGVLLSRAESNNEKQLSTSTGTGACLVAGSDDLAVEMLASLLNRHDPPLFAHVLADTSRALTWLESAAVLGVTFFGELLSYPPVRLARLHIAHEQWGLVGPHGRPIPSLSTVVRRGIRLASWQPHSDVRQLLDAAFIREGLDSNRLHRHSLLLASHAQVVSALLRGEADLGVTTASWAHRCSLPFVALGSRPLGLLVSISSLSSPLLIHCWETIQSAAFRESLERAGGYDISEAGALRYLPWRESAPMLPRMASQSPSTATRLAVLARASGADAAELIHSVLQDIQARGVRIGGFLELPRRSGAGVIGYDLIRVGRSRRVVVAKRSPPPTPDGGQYSRFHFLPSGFDRAWGWLRADARHSDVLVLDGISTLEANGEGHFKALAWACSLAANKTVLMCARRDQALHVLQRLGIDDRAVLQADLEACADPQNRRTFVDEMVRAIEMPN